MVLGKLRFAVVGTGNIAKQHVHALLSCGQNLVGVCNRHAEKALEFMQSFSGYEDVAPAPLQHGKCPAAAGRTQGFARIEEEFS